MSISLFKPEMYIIQSARYTELVEDEPGQHWVTRYWCVFDVQINHRIKRSESKRILARSEIRGRPEKFYDITEISIPRIHALSDTCKYFQKDSYKCQEFPIAAKYIETYLYDFFRILTDSNIIESYPQKSCENIIETCILPEKIESIDIK